jgi:hypothetical protein
LQVVAKNGDNVIKFDLAPKNQSLLVSAFAAGFGQGKELLACLQVMTVGGWGWRLAYWGRRSQAKRGCTDRISVTLCYLRSTVIAPARVRCDGADLRGNDTVCLQQDGPDEEPFSIAFNHKYLLDGLKAVTTAQVKLLCTFPNSPAIFVPFKPPVQPPGDGGVPEGEAGEAAGGSKGDFASHGASAANGGGEWQLPWAGRELGLGHGLLQVLGIVRRFTLGWVHKGNIRRGRERGRGEGG